LEIQTRCISFGLKSCDDDDEEWHTSSDATDTSSKLGLSISTGSSDSMAKSTPWIGKLNYIVIWYEMSCKYRSVIVPSGWQRGIR